jgi:hypothetical protein
LGNPTAQFTVIQTRFISKTGGPRQTADHQRAIAVVRSSTSER